MSLRFIGVKLKNKQIFFKKLFFGKFKGWSRNHCNP